MTKSVGSADERQILAFPSPVVHVCSYRTGDRPACGRPLQGMDKAIPLPSMVTCEACQDYIAAVRKREAAGLRRLPEGAQRHPTALKTDRHGEYALFPPNSAEIARVDH